MRVYLVQHGEATPKEVDPDRPLTGDGRRNVERVAGFLKAGNLHVSEIVHSGKTRAAQTADILSTAIASSKGVTRKKGLDPKDPVDPWKEKLDKAEDDRTVVGHLPFMSRLVSALVTGAESPEVVSFRQGGVACLERDVQGWRILWMVVPELLP